METVLCKCGCGESRPRFDKKGRERFYLVGHVNKEKSLKQIRVAIATLNKIRPRIPWNKGKSYVMKTKLVYANKGAWNQAMHRIYPEKCMRCSWDLAMCDTHHIIPKRQGGQFTLANGIILCPNCHRLADLEIVTREELLHIKDSFL